MEEIAFVSIPPDLMPGDAAALRIALEAHFPATYSTGDDGVLVVECDGARFALGLAPAVEDVDEELDPGPGVDVAGEDGSGDLVASFMELREALEAAFPGAEVSSAWDE